MPDARDSGALTELVRAEAIRAEAERQIIADARLLSEGWIRRFVTDAFRAEELAGLYRELGFVVRLEPVTEGQFADDCEGCRLAMLLHFHAIYTRKG